MLKALRLKALAVALVLAARPLAAQNIAAPCVYLGQPSVAKQCLLREAALADSMLELTLAATAAAQPAASRDSFLAQHRAWRTQYDANQATIADPFSRLSAGLFAKRARMFRLRYEMLLASAAPDTAHMHHMPVAVSFRPEANGRGQIMSLTNNIGRALDIQLRLYNPTTDELRCQQISIQPNASIRIGQLEGWPFATGQLIEILHVQYAPLLSVAP